VECTLPETIDRFHDLLNNSTQENKMAIDTQRLALHFQEVTGCPAVKAQKLTHQYIWLCALEMLRDNFTSTAGSRYYINATHIQNTLREIIVNKQKFWVWQTFQSLPERVFDIVQTGSNLNQQLSMAQARYTLEEVIMAAGTPEEFWHEVYQKTFASEILTQDYDAVEIDQRSLTNYIRSNLAVDRDQTGAQETETLERNLKHAQKIWMLAQARGGELVQIRNPSAFGRMYYKGPNLQNTPKIVRHAALGRCHEYDIESSVFAWKLSWFRQICAVHNTTISMPATLEYLDHKAAIRKKLAVTVFGTDADWAVKVIKEFITAIGFGAPLRGVGYVANGQYQKPALAQIITAKSRLDLAMADAWVQEFVQEQNNMNAAIVALAQVNMAAELKSVLELWEKGGRKLKPNSVVSYLYQHAEREILDWAEQFCEDREVLLTVHDCIYTRRPVPLAEFRAGIRQFGEFYRLEHQEHRAYGWQDPVLPTDPFYDLREAAVAQRNRRWDSAARTDHYIGAGHDGTQEYDLELDPYFDEPHETTHT
jgi:hypothetical protein